MIHKFQPTSKIPTSSFCTLKELPTRTLLWHWKNMKPRVPQKWKYEQTHMSPMDENLSLLRTEICTIFTYHYSTATRASIPSAWCQQCWFGLLKSYAFTIIFTILVFSVTSFTSSLLCCYLFTWQFDFHWDGSFWEWKETCGHQTDVLFSSLHVL